MNIKKTIPVIIVILLTACSTSTKTTSRSSSSLWSSTVYGTLTSTQKQEVAMMGFSMLNTKYNWGGKKPDFGLDCSGLVTYVFQNSIGMKISGAARHMAEKGKNVPLSQVNTLEPGDLLFFNTTGKSFSHVGIYIGEGKFLHASSGKGQVIISQVSNKYYSSRLERIKRM